MADARRQTGQCSRRVLLTGATGNWGCATLRAFRDRPEYRVVAFAKDTPSDRAVLDEFADMSNLEIVWGDLTQSILQ